MCRCRDVSSHLGQLLLRREAQSEHGVGPAVGPLTELLRRLGERHVGCDGAVDDHLLTQNNNHVGDHTAESVKVRRLPVKF